jgi:hypothetical protein
LGPDLLAFAAVGLTTFGCVETEASREAATAEPGSRPSRVYGEAPDGGTIHAEQAQLLALFPIDEATDVVVQDGGWGNPATWRSAQIPRPNARVLVPEGLTLLIDGLYTTAPLTWLRVDGNLRFEPRRNTGLKVATLFIGDRGSLEIGSPAERVQADKTALILFADRGPRDREKDPFDLTGGLISLGRVRLYGAEHASFAHPTNPVSPGTRSIDFSAAPSNWRVGDILVLPGTDAVQNQDEEFTVAAVSADGRKMFLDQPIRFHHGGPSGVRVPVGNLTRNIVLESEARAIHERRAHVMFLHRQTGVEIDSVRFHGLGRTRADLIHTQPALDNRGRVQEGSDANTIGRYAVHFHVRKGARRAVPPHVVRRAAIVDSPKHGLVNHGGHVEAENNVTYQIAGSHFFAENGSELGIFRANLAIRSTGSDDSTKNRMYSLDLGHTGHGFWLQGGGVEVTDNFAFGHRSFAFIFHQYPSLLEDGREVMMDSANLLNPEIAGGKPTFHPSDVPIRFQGNVAAGSGGGLAVQYHRAHLQNSPRLRYDGAESPTRPDVFWVDRNSPRNPAHGQPSIIADSTFWSLSGSPVDFSYSHYLTLRRLRLIADAAKPQAIAIRGNSQSSNLRVEDVEAQGFEYGIVLPRRGSNEILGGYFDNHRNIAIPEAAEPGRHIRIKNVEFGRRASSSPVADDQPYDLFLATQEELRRGVERRPPAWGWTTIRFADFSANFEADTILYQGQRLYFISQAADAIPFVDTGISEIDGRTSAWLWSRYRLAIGGAVAPPDAKTVPGIRGLVGNAPVAEVPIELTSSRWTKKLTGYVPRVIDTAGRVIAGNPVELREGWNLVEIRVDGVKRTQLVCGDTQPPVFKWAEDQPRTIHPADLADGLLVAGRSWDLWCAHPARPFEWKAGLKYRYVLRDLSLDGQVARSQVRVADEAGNESLVPIALEVTFDAVRRGASIDYFGGETHGFLDPMPPAGLEDRKLPNDPLVYVGLAQAFREAGDLENARKAHARARELQRIGRMIVPGPGESRGKRGLEP